MAHILLLCDLRLLHFQDNCLPQLQGEQQEKTYVYLSKHCLLKDNDKVLLSYALTKIYNVFTKVYTVLRKQFSKGVDIWQSSQRYWQKLTNDKVIFTLNKIVPYFWYFILIVNTLYIYSLFLYKRMYCICRYIYSLIFIYVVQYRVI